MLFKSKRKRKQLTATEILMLEIDKTYYEFDRLARLPTNSNGKKHSYADQHPAGINVIF